METAFFKWCPRKFLKKVRMVYYAVPILNGKQTPLSAMGLKLPAEA
jgi:hypothetical protein